MTAAAVESALRHARGVILKWAEIGEVHWPGENSWREDQTRYVAIDPVIRALGWDTGDPKECYIEYPRPYGEGRVEYALFGEKQKLPDIGRGMAVPSVIIEAKSIGSNLDVHLPQLEGYVRAYPPMRDGVAVLTNGEEWRLYHPRKGGRLDRKPNEIVNLQEGTLGEAARVLDSELARSPRRR